VAGESAQVKSAEDCLPGIDVQIKTLPVSSFADNGRRWPCHTKEATLVSAAYIADEGEKVEPDTVANLCKFAEMWGVDDQVRAVLMKVGFHNHLKSAAADATIFALNEEFDGQPVQRFPVDTPELTKLSADRFYADRSKYPYDWRQKTAEALLERVRHAKVASWLHEDVLTYLEKAAGEGLGSTSSLWRELAQRHCLAKHQAGLDKLAEAVEGLQGLSESGLLQPEHVKLACQAFHVFDTNARIHDMVRLPEEALIADDHTMTKVAAERSNWVKLANGRHIDLRTISQEKLAAAAPKLAGKSIDELRTILPTLPAAAAEVIGEVA